MGCDESMLAGIKSDVQVSKSENEQSEVVADIYGGNPNEFKTFVIQTHF